MEGKNMGMDKFYTKKGQRNGICQHCDVDFQTYPNLVEHWKLEHAQLYYRFSDEKFTVDILRPPEEVLTVSELQSVLDDIAQLSTLNVDYFGLHDLVHLNSVRRQLEV